MSVVKCDKHNVIFNPHNGVCASCYSDEQKEAAYTPSLLQELRNKADFVAVKENELSDLKSQLTAAQDEITLLKAKLKKFITLSNGLSIYARDEYQRSRLEMTDSVDLVERIDKLYEHQCNCELNSITLESLKK